MPSLVAGGWESKTTSRNVTSNDANSKRGCAGSGVTQNATSAPNSGSTSDPVTPDWLTKVTALHPMSMATMFHVSPLSVVWRPSEVDCTVPGAACGEPSETE